MMIYDHDDGVVDLYTADFGEPQSEYGPVTFSCSLQGFSAQNVIR